MNALTLTQPWASLVAAGAKRIETRSWRPPAHAVGEPLAIHAGRGLGRAGGRAGLERLLAWPEFHEALAGGRGTPDAVADRLPLGAVVAVCRLHSFRRTQHVLLRGQLPGMAENERLFGDYTPGRWAWILAGVTALPEPVPCAGAQRLWRLPDDVERDVISEAEYVATRMEYRNLTEGDQ